MNTPCWEAGGWTALVGGNPTEPIGGSRVNDKEGKVTRAGARMQARGREQRRWVKPRRLNGAYGKSDIEGKIATEAASELGKERVSNAREHMRQSAGTAEFQSREGISEIEGKAAR